MKTGLQQNNTKRRTRKVNQSSPPFILNGKTIFAANTDTFPFPQKGLKSLTVALVYLIHLDANSLCTWAISNYLLADAFTWMTIGEKDNLYFHKTHCE